MSMQLPRNTPAKKPIPPTPSPVGQKKPVPAPVKPISKPPAAPRVSSAPAAARNTKPPVKKPALPSSTPKPKPKALAVQPPATKAPSAPAGPGNWINREVQSRVAGVGSYAGGLITGVGNGVNAVGTGIGNRIADTTRYWGQGVSGYGNNLKDAVGAGGPRVATAGNPLGIAGVGQGTGVMRQAQQKAGGITSAGGGAVRGGAVNPLGL